MAGGIVDLGRPCTDEEHYILFQDGLHACICCGKILSWQDSGNYTNYLLREYSYEFRKQIHAEIQKLKEVKICLNE